MIASLSKGNLLDVLQEGFNEQQLVAYVSWVNAQLKKKPGLTPVRDLRQDLRDGVVLVHLIEIVAGEVLEGIHFSPKDNQEKRENVEKVLQFVSSKRIRMPQTSARDIVEGNLKSAMRLILALAAHFKPSASANHRAGGGLGKNSPSSLANHRPHSAMAMAQNAAAALAAARSDASRSGRSVHQLRQDWHRRSSSAEEEIENPCWSVRALVQQYEGQGGADLDDTVTEDPHLSTSSPIHTPKDPTSLSEDKGQPISQLGQAKDPGAFQEPYGRRVGNFAWEEQLWEQQEQLEKEMMEARKMVSSLQALLLHGSLPDEELEVSLNLEEGENAEQQLVITRSRLDQSMEENLELKRELLKYKQEARNLQGVKDALQQRMSMQESSVLKLKQELLRTSMNRDELARQNAEVHKKLEERNRLLSEYKKDLGQKDRLLQQQQFKLDEALRKLTDSTSQQADLQRELEHKQRIIQELADRGEEELPGSPSNGYTHPAAPERSTARPHKGTEELHLVRDALRSLRNSFGGHDPQQHTLDTLEQGMASLMDRMYTLESRNRQERKGRVMSPGHKESHIDRDSWPSSTKMVHSHSSPMLNSSSFTKVLYFTDRSLTPFMINIPKRLGEITLQDFKVAIDREGSYRYHFKALDPEFGTVKEEVFQDEAVVPGWEGKIVAWVEEDHGEGSVTPITFQPVIISLLEAQYRQPTEIQRQTIGFALQGRDILGAAKTGSGKTLAFLIPVLECLYRNQWTAMDGLGALIISPTRELAYQTFEVLRKVGKNHEFSAGLVIGGKDLKDESLKIHRTNIVICTPGRLLQHMDENSSFHASNLHMLVLDEADRILDMGFADTLNAIVENLPKTRQTLLFSATQTKSVKDLARLSLKNPEYVWVHEQAKFSTPATLEQSYVVCNLHEKVNMLFSFLRSHLQKKIIVQYLFRVFCRLRPGISVLALHGKQQQMKRVEVYNDFVRKKAAVLFATDIAARGLDFPAVNWVLQFDCPEDANTYIHRVGRTARYKEGGEALLILLPSEEKGMIAQLQEKKVPINKIQVNPEKLICVRQKLEAFLAQEKEQKERAQRCFVSYLRSIFLMKNKDVFDVFQLKLPEYATSLGLAVPPRVRFLNKAQKQKDGVTQEISTAESDSDEELKNFKAQFRKDQSSNPDSQTEEDEDESDEEEVKSGDQLCGLDDTDDEDEDLKDLDLLTVKRKDVFNVNEDKDEKEHPIAKSKTVSKFKDAKKAQKRNFKVNTKKVFTEDGESVQQWPPLQRTVVSDDEEDEEEAAGINIEVAKERLRREDQEVDKPEHRKKIKDKHREKRLKEKAERREASKRAKEEKKKKADFGGDDDDDDDADANEEVVAYLSGADDEEFDPSTLPDPDKVCNSEDEEEESSDGPELTGRKRTHSSSEEDNHGQWGTGRKKAKQHSSVSKPLDTGLSLAEDEELVLQLLGGQS
ncbi:putative ATP-dependent RNA helicase DDX10 [Bagarius yarrelli]|uniref:Dixin n=1 Tax=Bagarius yarrelli TaxID=175774 RepID=A0A556TX15_BAGYA|nr:putative ATP-dependent RNA helicase DDX10 [Bagarius yarrelli]